MRFQVPQFIEVESKIFGPLTIKQFIYLAGGAGILFLLYISLPFFLVVLFGVPIGGFAVALAFYKKDNMPFIKVVENALRYSSETKVYIWKKDEVKKKDNKTETEKNTPQIYTPKLTESKLKDLSWSLNIKRKMQ